MDTFEESPLNFLFMTGVVKHLEQLEYDDVLIAIVGATIGQVSVYKDKKPANINQALALVRVDKSKILLLMF